jgi:DNA repair protein RecN (Recombination protein N)
MGQTVFEVLFNEESGGRPIMPSPEGDDRIVFMISPNPGEPLKPISKIASGGELSRLMLAIKTIESHNSEKKTMIFDEIDTGISGRIAQAVAEKMMQISRRQQVICISHLPQIASSSDHHFLVYKAVKGDRTFTEISELDYKEHILEIARMISGAQGISEDAKAYAEQLVMSSDKIKERFSV